MKKYIVIWMMILLLLLGACAPAAETPAGEGSTPDNTQTTDPVGGAEETEGDETTVEIGDTPISCMSFNILAYNTGGTKYPTPEERYKAIIPYILEQNADIVGIQEADESHGNEEIKDFNWPSKIAEDTKSVYTARRIDEEYEYGNKQMNIAAGLMILYRTDRFELLNSGCTYFWEDNGRWFQWVLLKDKKAGKEIYVTNTHWSINPMAADGVSRDIEQGNFLRCSEAEELVTWWEENVKDKPLFATGDYNCTIDSDPQIQYLTRGIYGETCTAALESDGDSSVDFVYYNTKAMNIEKYQLMPRDYTFADGNKLAMSDHRSVLVHATY